MFKLTTLNKWKTKKDCEGCKAEQGDLEERKRPREGKEAEESDLHERTVVFLDLELVHPR